MTQVRVFIGSDERGGRGEIVLNHGIKKWCPDAEVISMRPGGEYQGVRHWEYGDWNMGRTHHRPYSGEGWATNFTCYRWSIPEVAGFVGRAVYMDADQTVHGDVRELLSFDLRGKACSIRKGVILFDCEHPYWTTTNVEDGQLWPDLASMKRSGAGLGHYQAILKRAGQIGVLFPEEWDVLDGKEMSVWKAKLNHYTAMQWQPYHPFPDRFAYPHRHPRPEVDEVWWRAYKEALVDLIGIKTGGPSGSSYELMTADMVVDFKKFGNLVKQCIDMEHRLGLDCFGREHGFPMWFTDRERFAHDSARLNPGGFRANGRFTP